jgi:hypothetical protein
MIFVLTNCCAVAWRLHIRCPELLQKSEPRTEAVVFCQRHLLGVLCWHTYVRGLGTWVLFNLHTYISKIIRWLYIRLALECTRGLWSQEFAGKSLNTTATGKPCLPWNNERSTIYTKVTGTLDESTSTNYCRNPFSDEDKLWCYISDATANWGVYFDYCAVAPTCPEYLGT